MSDIKPSETIADVVRRYFPDATSEQVDHILWNHTGFPAFFVGDPITALRSQLCAFATLGPSREDDDGCLDAG
jgi:hypothetical protein